ncbi:hypothetical protein QQP08_000224 [Theobroma cacao]|nr:hypothetical protein QQP08_000224 [Theobroma cacao]
MILLFFKFCKKKNISGKSFHGGKFCSWKVKKKDSYVKLKVLFYFLPIPDSSYSVFLFYFH